MEKTFKMDKSQVVEIPKDVILDGIVVDVLLTTWRELLDNEESIKKFNNPDQQIVNIKFECKHEDKIFKGTQNLTYDSNPSSNSKLGKFLNKYETLEAGTKIKVLYDGEGYPEIKLK